MGMTNLELNELVEDLISIRDKYRDEMSRYELSTLADACNVIYKNIDVLRSDR